MTLQEAKLTRRQKKNLQEDKLVWLVWLAELDPKNFPSTFILITLNSKINCLTISKLRIGPCNDKFDKTLHSLNVFLYVRDIP